LRNSTNKKLKIFLEKNKEAFENPIIMSFLNKKENYKLLESAILNPSYENMNKIDDAFKKHYMKIRKFAYISKLIHNFSIDYDKKANRYKNHHTLILDQELFEEDNTVTFKDIIEDNSPRNLDLYIYGKKLINHIGDYDLYKAINQLTDNQVKILEMRYLRDMQTNEIAQKLDTSPQNISNQHSKAIKKIRKILEEKGVMEY